MRLNRCALLSAWSTPAALQFSDRVRGQHTMRNDGTFMHTWMRKTCQRSAQDTALWTFSLIRLARDHILHMSVAVIQVTGVSVTCQSDWLTGRGCRSRGAVPEPWCWKLSQSATWPEGQRWLEKLNTARVKWLGSPGGWGSDVIQPCQKRDLRGPARDNKSIHVEYAEKRLLLSVSAVACTYFFLTQQWNLQDVHFTEQMRLFHVGGSVECVGFCALVPARNPNVLCLCLIASASNAEDEIYNTALRDKCMLVLIQVFFFFST